MLNIVICCTLFLFGNLSTISKTKISSTTSSTKKKCIVSPAAVGWNKSSVFCGKVKHRLDSWDECERTTIFRPTKKFAWFYCFPKKNNRFVYYRIELRACIAFNKTYKTLGYGSGYNKYCTKPTKANKIDKMIFQTKCKYKKHQIVKKSKFVTFDARDYFKFKDEQLVCRTDPRL